MSVNSVRAINSIFLSFQVESFEMFYGVLISLLSLLLLVQFCINDENTDSNSLFNCDCGYYKNDYDVQ